MLGVHSLLYWTGFLPSFGALETEEGSILEGLRKNVWWDNAGPTFPHQIVGLLAYGIPTSQLVYGTDYPYTHASYNTTLVAILNSTLLNGTEKEDLFMENALRLYGL